MTFRSKKRKAQQTREHTFNEKATGKTSDGAGVKVLQIPLRHGTVVIQQGLDLQRHFEHQVVPLAEVGKEGAGGIRMALTARYIDAIVNDKQGGIRKDTRQATVPEKESTDQIAVNSNENQTLSSRSNPTSRKKAKANK